jgi:outer membrane protein OmpA-like peptidoglycan-associated protein
MRHTSERPFDFPGWHYRVVVGFTAWLICATASAQEQDDSFQINLFEPAPGPLNFFSVEAPEIGDDMMPAVGLMFYYQHKPFVIFNCDAEGNCGDEVQTGGIIKTINVVENLMAVDVLGSFNFLKRFQAGLAIPMYIWQRGDTYDVVTEGAPPNQSQWLLPDTQYNSYGVMGDLRIHLKARIIGKERKDGPVLSAAVIPALPMAYWMGYSKGYAGEGFLSVTAPKILFGYRFGSLRTAANVGVTWREKSELFSAAVGHTLKYGVALGYSVIPEVELIAEVYGQKSFVSENFTDLESSPLLFLGGGRFTAGDFVFHVAGGGGILSGIGVPQFQVIGGAAWAPRGEEEEEEDWFPEWDIDGDGIDNDIDDCPEQPEDLDGFDDDNGCPDNDNDQDGVDDGYDSCPNEQEDKDNFRDDDGCPDLDHDEDGIKEPDDACPAKAEDYDEYQDEDGCPDEDNDGDGFKDAEDACPDIPEDKDGFEDDDGCGDLDNDKDGVNDDQDKCPDKPETLNGFKDDDGCPDKGKALVIVTEEKIELKQKIQFKKNSDEIKGDKSFEILDIVSRILAGNVALRVSIEGHTDSRGNSDYNRELSKKRAESVKKYLVDKGIEGDRLETVGWGPDKPIASNKKKKGRAKNRRVEFVIIKPEKTVIEPEAGQEEGAGAEMDFTSGESSEGEMDFTVDDTKDDSEIVEEEDDMDFTEEGE